MFDEDSIEKTADLSYGECPNQMFTEPSWPFLAIEKIGLVFKFCALQKLKKKISHDVSEAIWGELYFCSLKSRLPP